MPKRAGLDYETFGRIANAHNPMQLQDVFTQPMAVASGTTPLGPATDEETRESSGVRQIDAGNEAEEERKEAD
jgi:hypothetical protein